MGLVGRPGRDGPRRGHRQAPGLGARRRRVRRPARRGLARSPRSTSCAQSGFTPRRPLGVANFADEEGARFGVACVGSRLLTGALDRRAGPRAAPTPTASRWPRRCAAAGHDPAARPGPGDAAADRHLRRAARRAGPRRWPTSTGRSASAPRSGRTAGGGSTSPARPTTPAPPGWPTAATRCSASPRSCSPPGAAAERHGAVATVGKVRVEPERRQRDPVARSPAWLDARGADAERGAARSSADGSPRPAARVTEESWTADDRASTRRWPTRLAARARRRAGAAAPAPATTPGILAAAGPDRDAVRPQPDRGLALAPPSTPSTADCLRRGRRAGRRCSRELAG